MSRSLAHIQSFTARTRRLTALFCAMCSSLQNVDVGHGWLIFGLPASEVAVHPSEKNDVHEFYLMCDDVNAFVAQMARHQVVCGPVQDQRYGLFTQLTLPGGGKLGVYPPRHARPRAMPAK